MYRGFGNEVEEADTSESSLMYVDELLECLRWEVMVRLKCENGRINIEKRRTWGSALDTLERPM